MKTTRYSMSKQGGVYRDWVNYVADALNHKLF